MEEHKHLQVNHNFLLNQYKETGVYPINHNYLFEQFSDYKEIFEQIENLITNCDYTLGKSVDEFERKICELTGSRFAVGVGSGTDALFLSLIAAGIQKGDEVITTPYTFTLQSAPLSQQEPSLFLWIFVMITISIQTS